MVAHRARAKEEVTVSNRARNLETLLDQARAHYERADLHLYFKGNLDSVTRAQVALDTAEDAMLAISNYWSKGIGSNDGEKYLRLYGFLQAVVLQQDAITNLYQLFLGRFTEPDASAWKQLRELRNLTVGHPIDKGWKKQPRRRAFITRISLETHGFDYQVWNQRTEKTSFESVNVSKLYDAYRKQAASFLNNIITRLSCVPNTSC